ncbi:hypothetical protein HDV00_000396 [Rhizophlyctis rosea]|nr:hypothetical protein HDV00_000396 [Rhizophlyctis rosea]
MSEIEKLELDNQKMEERLNALRDSLAKQKEKRTTTGSESVWRGGEARNGSLGAYAQEVLAKKRQAAKAKRASFSGTGTEADHLRKGLETALKTQVGSANDLRRPQPAPLAQERLHPQPPGRTQPASRPPRLWRFPSGVDQSGPLSSSLSLSSPDLHTPSSNLAHRASARRVSYAPSYTAAATSPRTEAGFVDIPSILPTDGIDTIDARDHAFAAAEEGRSDDMTVTSPVGASAGSGAEAGAGIAMGTNSLLEGTFDEAASHRDFVEALEEWRRSRGMETRISSLSPSRRANMAPQPPTSNSNPTSDFYGQFMGETSGPVQSPESNIPPHRRPSAFPDFMRLDENAATFNARRGSVAAFIGLTREARSQSDTSVLPIVNEVASFRREQVGMQRPRSGSLATLGKSLSSLGASLGQVLGISGQPGVFDGAGGGVGGGSLNTRLSSSDPEIHNAGLSHAQAGEGHVSASGDSLQNGGGRKGSFQVGSHDSGVDVKTAPSKVGVSTSTTTTDTPPQWSRKAAEELFAEASNRARRPSRVVEGLSYMEKLLMSKYRGAVGSSSDLSKSPTGQAEAVRETSGPDLEMGNTAGDKEEVVDLEGLPGGDAGTSKGQRMGASIPPPSRYGIPEQAFPVYNDEGSSGEEPDSEEESADAIRRGDNHIKPSPSSVGRTSFDSSPSPVSRPLAADLFEIEDVTANEVEVMQGAMSSGRVVEMVGGERLRVEEPNE